MFAEEMPRKRTEQRSRLSQRIIASMLLILCGTFVAFPPVASATDAEAEAASNPIPLGRAVPSDVFLFVHGKSNPERAFLDAHYGEVWEAFQDSGVIDAVMDILAANMPGDKKGEMTMAMDTVKKFGEMVDWWELVSNETAFAMRMEFPTPDYMMISRPNAKSYAGVLEGLQSILTEIQKLQADLFTLETAQRGNAEITALSFGSNVPVEVCVAGIDGVIILTTSTEDVRSCIDLYLGKANGSIIDHGWLKEGLEKLPAYEDSLSFVNMENLFDGYSAMLENAMKMDSEDPEKEQILDVVQEALDHFRLMRSVTAVGTTNKNMTISETYTKLAPGSESLPIYKAFADRTRFTDFHKYIPKDVTSFSLNGGVDLSILYNMAIDFVKTKVPEGEEMIKKWDAMQTQWGIDVSEDLLSWISGETISFSLPAAAPSGMGMGMGGEFVNLIKVRDAEKGQKVVTKGIAALNNLLKNIGQALIIAPAADAGEGFQSIMYPMVPFIKPVIGFEGDYLVIASSGKALDAMRKVQAGEAPSVLENPKFAALGIDPKGAVASISYQDQSATYEGMAQMFAMIPMFAGMALQGNEPQMKIARDLVNVLPLLAPVVQKLDFHLATSSYTRDDEGGSYSRVVNSYRKEDDA